MFLDFPFFGCFRRFYSTLLFTFRFLFQFREDFFAFIVVVALEHVTDTSQGFSVFHLGTLRERVCQVNLGAKVHHLPIQLLLIDWVIHYDVA